MGSTCATLSRLSPKLGLPTKVIIGGAPVTQSYADEIKAHGYSPDATSAVEKAKSLI